MEYHAERLAAALQGLIWGMISADAAQEILDDYRQSKKEERKMGNISRALEQMQRGLASKQGRDEVNAETLAQREKWAQERAERLSASAAMPSPDPAETWQDRLQRGDFGSLD